MRNQRLTASNALDDCIPSAPRFQPSICRPITRETTSGGAGAFSGMDQRTSDSRLPGATKFDCRHGMSGKYMR
jgi:hypothetical protein